MRDFCSKMNDQSQIMNQHQVQSRSQVFLANQSHKIMNQSQMMMNQSQMLNRLQNQRQMVNQQSSQATMVNQLSQPMISQPQMVNQSKMMGQSYGQWSQPLPNMPLLPNPMDATKFGGPLNQMYGGNAKPKRNSWKAKKLMARDKRKDVRWKGKASGMAVGGYQPPALHELEQQNRLKARRFYHKKRFNRMGPSAHAPRNTTSYIIRAKKSGGIASLVSPCPVTPAVLPTPVFSPSREALVEMAKEEWGVDGYGSMKGLIRLRSPGYDETLDDYEEEDEEGSTESDVEEHVEVERRLDHDLSRFEMINPNGGVDYHNVLENRVDDQGTHIVQLEEENLILKERLYLMEREVGELRRRLLCLERQHQVVEDINEEVVENVSENDSGGLRSTPLCGGKYNEEVDFVPRNAAEESGSRRDDSCNEISDKVPGELPMTEGFHNDALENNHNDEQVQEPGIAEREEQKSRDNEAVGDVCMGEGVAEEIIEHDRFSGVNKKKEINSDHNGVMPVEAHAERGKQIVAIE